MRKVTGNRTQQHLENYRFLSEVFSNCKNYLLGSNQIHNLLDSLRQDNYDDNDGDDGSNVVLPPSGNKRKAEVESKSSGDVL